MKFLLGAAAVLHTVQRAHALSNPIIPGFNPDPSLLHDSDLGFFVATSSFEHFPGVPIYHSTDLANWTLVNHALQRPSQLALYGTPPDAAVWAPTLRKHNGTYYLITTTRYVYTPELRTFPRSFYVKTEDIIHGTWSDPVYFDALSYDPDLFFDDDGKVYNTYCGLNNANDKIYGIYQNEIDLETGNALTERKLIWNGTLPVTASSRPEGPHLYKVGNYYYLLIAEGGTGVTHRSTIARSHSPSGPWESAPGNPLIYNGANKSLEVQQTGHSDIAQGPDGRWWGVCLGTRPQGGNFSRTQLGRETFLFPVTWNDSWPIFNNGQPITTSVLGLSFELPPKAFFDNFTSASLDLGYYYIRTPQKPFASVDTEREQLVLKGGAFALGDRDSPSALLRKQTSYEELWEAEIEFSPLNNYTEAGVTIFYSDFYHDEIAVAGCPDSAHFNASRCIRTRIITRNRGASLTTADYTIISVKHYALATTSSPVQLAIQANSAGYTFGYREAGDTTANSTYQWVAQVDGGWLSTAPSGWSHFKGTQWGIYNTANFEVSLEPARFNWVRQTPATGGEARR